MRAVLLTILATGCAQVSLAQPAQVQAKHARLEILLRDTALVPGRNSLLGVRFILERGWHIYWINPGDSGQPPTLTWRLPDGLTAGETEWPRPERLQDSPTIADYGYRDEVLLMVPLHVSGSVTARARMEIALSAKWLICREVCLPDHAEISLPLRINSTAAPDPHNAPLFAHAASLLPKAWPAGWKASVESRKEDFLLRIETGKPLKEAEFFPLNQNFIDNAAKQRLESSATGGTIVLKKSDLLVKPIRELSGVLVIGRTQYAVRAPVLTQVAVK